MCRHQPPRPSAYVTDAEAARVVAGHPEQGWSLRRNGVVVFDDPGELLPNGRPVQPHRAALPHRPGDSPPASRKTGSTARLVAAA